MGLAASGLLAGASVLPWMGFVTAAVIGGLAFPVFGVQANLWDLAGPSPPIAIVSFVPFATALLIVAASFAALMRGWAAAVLTLVALLLFLAGTEALFGIHVVGSAFTVVSLGPGMLWAVAGLLAGAVSPRFRSRPAAQLIRGLRTPGTLAQVGIFLAGGFLAIDAADHASGGNVLAVFGNSGAEFVLHGLFIGGIAALAGLYLLRPARASGWEGQSLVVVAAAGLLLDAMFHASTGDLAEFIGHTGAEVVAHLATYYGIALLMIAAFVMRES